MTEPKQMPTSLMLIKVFGVMVAYSFILLVVSLMAAVFTSGGGDWGDGVYFRKIDLLVGDEIRVNYITGFCSALLLAGEAYWIYKIVKNMPAAYRSLILAVALGISLIIALTVFGPRLFIPTEVQ